MIRKLRRKNTPSLLGGWSPTTCESGGDTGLREKRSPLDRITESIFSLPLCAGLNSKKSAFLRTVRQMLLCHGEPRRRYKEGRQIRPAKGATCRPAARQFDKPFQAAVRLEAGDARAAGNPTVPEPTVGVKAGAIGSAPVDRRSEDPLVGKRANSEVIGEDLVAKGVSHKKEVVPRPSHCVGDAEFAWSETLDAAVGVDTIDSSTIP